MVASSINAERGASDLANDAAEVGMEILFEFGFDESAALFGAEYEMHEQIRGGVRHVSFAPSGLALFVALYPRLAPWAIFFRHSAASLHENSLPRAT